MKVWHGYGSEHSANLVMVGHFASDGDAKTAEAQFQRLAEQVRSDLDANLMDLGYEREDRFTDGMLDLLGKLRLYSLGPLDAESFAYDYSVERKGAELILRTEELDVAGFLKLMIDGGAKVEVYSAHAHPDEASGSAR